MDLCSFDIIIIGKFGSGSDFAETVLKPCWSVVERGQILLKPCWNSAEALLNGNKFCWNLAENKNNDIVQWFYK